MWKTYEDMLAYHVELAEVLRPAFQQMPPLTKEWEQLVAAFHAGREVGEMMAVGPVDHDALTLLTCAVLHRFITPEVAERLAATLPATLGSLERFSVKTDVPTYRAVLQLAVVAAEVEKLMLERHFNAPSAEA